MFIAMTVLTGLLYPALITVAAQLTMPHQANGSLIKKKDKIIGSALIAQAFASERYFWPRPSAVDYNATSSGGSNLGPTSKKLKDEIEERTKKIQASSDGKSASIPSELVYASGSGLDPHISIPAAYFQAERVAKARSIDLKKIKSLINSLAEGEQWGVIGPQYVNVLLLNLALDEQYPLKK